MRTMNALRTIVLVALVSPVAVNAAVDRSDQTAPAKPPAADNTTQNKKPGPTADQQSQSKADLALVKQIRQAVMKDKTLSTTAHNCKIITRDGAVLLRGPVNSEAEKVTVNGIAVKIAGAGKVTNELAVKSIK